MALVDTVTTPGLASKVMAMKSLSPEAQVMSMAKPLSCFSLHGPFFLFGFRLSFSVFDVSVINYNKVSR